MFGENLKAMRKAKGYTQEELAIKINVVRQTVSKWEKGLSVPDADMLSQIAEVLDTKVSVLLGGTISNKEQTKQSNMENHRHDRAGNHALKYLSSYLVSGKYIK